MAAFTDLVDLAAARLGGVALLANDEFFAEKENLLQPEKPIWIEGKYTDRGKWMDGWESRRRRTPGHDWCIIRRHRLLHGEFPFTLFARCVRRSRRCGRGGAGVAAGHVG
jgi:allantoicase